jgi:large subunit ribosomal protein L19
MNRLDSIENTQLRDNIPAFQSGDSVRVHVRIQEGNKERLQIFEGIVIAKKHGGSRETVTVRKVSFGVGVERIFPLHGTLLTTLTLRAAEKSAARNFITCAICAEKRLASKNAIRATKTRRKQRRNNFKKTHGELRRGEKRFITNERINLPRLCKDRKPKSHPFRLILKTKHAPTVTNLSPELMKSGAAVWRARSLRRRSSWICRNRCPKA